MRTRHILKACTVPVPRRHPMWPKRPYGRSTRKWASWLDKFGKKRKWVCGTGRHTHFCFLFRETSFSRQGKIKGDSQTCGAVVGAGGQNQQQNEQVLPVHAGGQPPAQKVPKGPGGGPIGAFEAGPVGPGEALPDPEEQAGVRAVSVPRPSGGRCRHPGERSGYTWPPPSSMAVAAPASWAVRMAFSSRASRSGRT